MLDVDTKPDWTRILVQSALYGPADARRGAAWLRQTCMLAPGGLEPASTSWPCSLVMQLRRRQPSAWGRSAGWCTVPAVSVAGWIPDDLPAPDLLVSWHAQLCLPPRLPLRPAEDAPCVSSIIRHRQSHRRLPPCDSCFLIKKYITATPRFALLFALPAKPSDSHSSCGSKITRTSTNGCWYCSIFSRSVGMRPPLVVVTTRQLVCSAAAVRAVLPVQCLSRCLSINKTAIGTVAWEVRCASANANANARLLHYTDAHPTCAVYRRKRTKGQSLRLSTGVTDGPCMLQPYYYLPAHQSKRKRFICT